MSVEWASDDVRKEVPTMRNTILHGEAAVIAHGFAVACPGTAQPAAVTTPFVQCTGVFKAAPRSAVMPLTAVIAAAQPTTFANYQDKTRISAAGGGVSGSPPAWDPV
jgi:hypothetical protein